MRAVVQRVNKAKVIVDNETVSQIGKGLLILIGACENDTQADIKYIINKTVNLRVFADENANMNLSVKDVGGEILAVSQFTLCGDCRKGRRPSFSDAMKPDKAKELFDKLLQEYKQRGFDVKTGVFGAMMDVELVNSGPVTLLIDSEKKF